MKLKNEIFKNKKLIIMVTFCFCFVSALGFSQGFQRLEDKYGASKNTPIKSSTNAIYSNQNEYSCSSNKPLPQGLICLNVVEEDLNELIKLVSKRLGKDFILSNDIRTRKKITILSDKPMDSKMAYNVFLTSLEMNGYTITKTPSGLYTIVAIKDALNKPLDLFKENSPNEDRFITRIVQLNNISAKEISSIIQPLKSKDGEISSYPTTNSLIISDIGSVIDNMLKLIKELDQEGPQEVIEFIPIVYADASDISQKVKEIYLDDSANKTSSRLRSRRRRSRSAGNDIDEVQAISKVIHDERTNSVIIKGTKRDIIKVKALIARLDRNMEGVEGRIHVYYLRHADAKEMSSVLQSLVSGSSSSKNKSKSSSRNSKRGSASSGSSVQLEGGVQVTADEATNSLIITASPKDFTTLVDKVIAKLDIVRPQVYIEAVIMSMDVSKTNSLGVSLFGGGTASIGGENLNIFGGLLPTGPAAISSIAGASGGIGGGAVSEKTIDFTLSDGSSISIPAISGIIQALQSDTDVNVLSTPSIMTLDNETAEIVVGQEVPVPAGSTVATGITSFDVERQDAGITLKIKPSISESDTVRLEIEQGITSVFSTDSNLGPTLDKKTVQTVVVAKNKQTIVIGGLIDDKSTVSAQKVPLLGDIPVLGNLFKTRTSTKQKTNLVVFITPYIIKNRGDYMAILKKKIEERNAFIKQNFGSSQRKDIRKAISNHASELLEFKCEYSDLTDPCQRGVSYKPVWQNANMEKTGNTITGKDIKKNAYVESEEQMKAQASKDKKKSKKKKFKRRTIR